MNTRLMKYYPIQHTGEICLKVVDRREHFLISRMRIRAVNAIGAGPFSSPVKCQTKSLPPDPPRLECIAITCNSIKLKLGNGNMNHTLSPPTESPTTTNSSRSMTYILEMEGKDGK